MLCVCVHARVVVCVCVCRGELVINHSYQDSVHVSSALNRETKWKNHIHGVSSEDEILHSFFNMCHLLSFKDIASSVTDVLSTVLQTACILVKCR